ncbi:nucleotide-diphospho-sugar transferase [Scheffersomyces amazonensis]|uniref:nucleotide-diphospho-sugar transferase n=1 Tax=Scheffersomyces amazonensis TaxID=1078765 RepID=UPI00315E01CC
MVNYFANRKRPIIITVIIIVLIIVGTKISTSKNSGKNFQEVLQNIPNDNILGLSKLIYNENEKNQDELFNRLEKMNRKMLQNQEQLLLKLAKQNEQLLQEIKSLKKPPVQASIREKLVYIYPYDPDVKFPAYIWQSWKHGLNDERFEENYREGERQWAWKNPGFVHELFNDDTAHTMIKYLFREIPEVIETYEALPEVILKMDFFRYCILFAKGGVYADIDTLPIQPIPNWIPENVSPEELGMIIAIEIDSSSPDWRTDSVRRLQFGQFVIQAKPGHPVLREMIANIIESTHHKQLLLNDNEHLKLQGSSNKKILEISAWTGSAAWTDTVLRYFNDYLQSSIYQKMTWKDFHQLKIPKLVSDILVLPINSFASEAEISNDGKTDDPLAFVKHYAAKIWKTT